MKQGLTSMMQSVIERRSSARFDTRFEGRIQPIDGASAVECVMFDVSSTGARIAFPCPTEMPLEFELHLFEEGASACGRLIWSNGKEHGIKFTD
jgi:hypothetical protein